MVAGVAIWQFSSLVVKVGKLRYLCKSLLWENPIKPWGFQPVRVSFGYLFVFKQNFQSNSKKCTDFSGVCFILCWMCFRCYQVLSVVIGFFSNSVQVFFVKH